MMCGHEELSWAFYPVGIFTFHRWMKLRIVHSVITDSYNFERGKIHFLVYLIGQNIGGQRFQRTKFFGEQNFRRQLEISAVLSEENFVR